MRRLWLLCPFLLVAALLVLPWLWAEGRLEAGLDRWVAERRAAGWTVRHAAPVRTGWPLAAALDLPDVSVSTGDAVLPGGLDWQVPVLRLSVSVLHPGSLVLEASGEQRLRLSFLPALALRAERMAASLPLDAPGTAFLTAADVAAGVPGGPAARAGSLAVSLAPGPAAAPLRFALEAAGIGLPPDRPWPLGPRVASLAVTGDLDGPLSGVAASGSAPAPPFPAAPPAVPPLAAPSLATPSLATPSLAVPSLATPSLGAPSPATQSLVAPAARAILWRDGGGRVAVSSLRLLWGPLMVTGSALLRLDGLLQPAGTADLLLSGWSEALEAMAAAGTVPSGTTVAAGAVLGLMARTPAGGGPSVVGLPLVLADRRLSAGRIPLLRVPALAWPGVAGN